MYHVVLLSVGKQVTDAFQALELWEGQEFVLDLVTEDIAEAMRLHPDVLICPAKSSSVDGADLARKAYNENMPVKILLYGRKTYDYAKLAVNSRAWGYIAMPVERADFCHLLMNLKQYIEHDDQHLDDGRQTQEDLPVLREYYFYNLLSGKITQRKEAEEGYQSLGFGEGSENNRSLLVKITIHNFQDYLENCWKYGKDSLYTAVNNFIMKTQQAICIVPVARKEKELFILLLENEKESLSAFKKKMDRYLQSVRKNTREIMGLELSSSVEQIYETIDQMITAAQEGSVLPQKFLTEENYQADKVITRPEDEKTVIHNAKEYINSCFNKEICLDDVASFVCLSSAYFSRLFKQETGENFIDYLVKIRMENGKKLLQTTGYKTYEVSQMVGYKKSKYFSKLFKNYTGYTPTEYRVRVNRKKQSERLKRF